MFLKTKTLKIINFMSNYKIFEVCDEFKQIAHFYISTHLQAINIKNECLNYYLNF